MYILLDAHHLILEELNFYNSIIKAGEYLGHFHNSENNRGIPWTGLVDWVQIYRALKKINYSEWLVIESFYVGFGNVWKPLADSPEQLITRGLENLKKFEEIVSKES